MGELDKVMLKKVKEVTKKKEQNVKPQEQDKQTVQLITTEELLGVD